MSMTMPYPIPANSAQWAADMEAVGGLPTSDTNALIAWQAAEGGGWDADAGNPLNTTRNTNAQGQALGGVPTNSAGVLDFGNTQQGWYNGIEAELATIGQSNMSDIAGALEQGGGGLPQALETDPWGTNGELVAQIMGESPDQLAALGNAAGSSSGGGGMVVAGNSATDTSITSALGGTALGFFGLQSGGHYIVRGAFAIIGIVLLIIAIKEMFGSNDAPTIITNAPQHIKGAAKDAGEAGAVAA